MEKTSKFITKKILGKGHLLNYIYQANILFKRAMLNKTKLNPLVLIFTLLVASASHSLSQVEAKYHDAMGHIATLDKHKAADVFNEILSENASHAPSIYQLALLESEFGNEISAQKRFKQVINLNKEFVSQAYLELSKVDIALGETQEAFDYLNLAVEKDTTLDEVYYELGKLHFDEKQYKEALKNANKALALNQKLADYYYLRGVANVELGNLAEAIKDFNDVIAKDNEIENAYFYRGYCYLTKGANANKRNRRDKLNKALADFNTCVKLDPKDDVAFYNRGETHMFMAELTPGGGHHYIDAIADFKSALQLNPNNNDAHFNKALCNYKYGYEEQALAEFETILKNDPKDADAMYQVALIKYEFQDFNAALDLYDKLVLLEEEPHKDTYLYRGYTLYELKQKKQACLDWKKADELGDREAHNDLRKYCKKYVDLKTLNVE